MRTQRLNHLLLSLFLFAAAFSSLHPTATAGDEGAPSAGDGDRDADFIRTSCNTTLYPEVCFTSLSRYANAVQQNPGHLARVAIAVSLSLIHI